MLRLAASARGNRGVLGILPEGGSLKGRREKSPPRTPRAHEKRTGSFYTPAEIALEVARRTLEPLHESGSPRVIDPACGAGALLLAAREVCPRARLFGADIDSEAIEAARSLLPRAQLEVRDALAADAFTASSFDAVIGNPPFVAAYARGAVALEPARRAFLEARFPTIKAGEANGFLHFLELALELVKPGGRVGLILPDTLLTNERYERARRELVARSQDLQAVVFDWPVFGKLGVRTTGVFCTRRDGAPAGGARVRVTVFSSAASLESGAPASDQTSLASELEERRGFAFPRGTTDHALEAKIRARGRPLETACWVRDGINPGPRDFRARAITTERPAGAHGHPLIEGRDIARWRVSEPRLWVNADPALLTPELKRRGCSFREPWIFDQEKLVSRQTSARLVFAREPRGYRALNSVHATGLLEGARVRLEAVLAILNSSVLSWYYARSSGETRRVFPQVHVSALRRLPLPAALWERPEAEAELVRLARSLEADSDQPQIERAVDAIVAALFGLTDAEVASCAADRA